ncbi:DNA-dependent ATPase protein rad54 [Tieghemiomyces parasiticus]|uniref:DNA-dependent ATPase protein rad54 n=1 Tax=Tieghemiomyces parasiticus TaxID=78921 RepID=A0A9W7ZZ43_9FUNG|nr:DNA-dependent ATPase protein rad54 [Tieghemiomyces parasiticus]
MAALESPISLASSDSDFSDGPTIPVRKQARRASPRKRAKPNQAPALKLDAEDVSDGSLTATEPEGSGSEDEFKGPAKPNGKARTPSSAKGGVRTLAGVAATPSIKRKIKGPAASPATPAPSSENDEPAGTAAATPAAQSNGIFCGTSLRTLNSIRKPFRTPFLKKPGEDQPIGGGPKDEAAGGDGSLMSPRGPSRALGVRRRINLNQRPLHDPTAEDAVILYEPPQLTESEKLRIGSGSATAALVTSRAPVRLTIGGVSPAAGSATATTSSVSPHKPQVHVIVDPILGKKLRPHQVEGVKFLYNCVTGRIVENAYGCIMADEMGLGKTSPDPAKPWIDKCIVVCPSSLVRNWANELVKWLGSVRISPYACDNKESKEKVTKSLHHFMSSRGRMNTQPVLIISYETLRTNINILNKGPIGLLLCDEGHRLKNANSQTFQALNQLQVQRRVCMTGTPIQNGLLEFLALLNFVNPGLLGTPVEFRKNFEIPILRGRDACATDQERLLSDQKLAELAILANKFIIRRTNDLLSKYLPTKYEHVVFCRPVPIQEKLYELFIQSKSVTNVLEGGGFQSLRAITILKKLCNHPGLINLPDDIPGSEAVWPPPPPANGGGGGRGAANSKPTWLPQYSGKMLLLDRMLAQISQTKDKIVLISNYTQTLDIFEHLCQIRRYGSIRLDGTMNTAKRQQLVDKFNNPQGPEFVFLLSSKAGGCGLNLIGANRLILFDPDWNPAADQQALARVWRDGQKKTCFIYRFVGTGTIEEKIFQRQSHKQSLSSCVVDEEQDVERHFSRDQLRQLFMYDPHTRSDTHATFRCRRCARDLQFARAPEPMAYGDTSTWDHFSDMELNKAEDGVLKKCSEGLVSYVFQYKSHDTPGI